MGKQLRHAARYCATEGRWCCRWIIRSISARRQGLRTRRELVALARDHGATAVLLTAGALRQAVDEIGDLGVIMRIDTTITKIGGPDTVMHLLHSAEEAAALGADMVVVNCYVGHRRRRGRIATADEDGGCLGRVRAHRDADVRRDHPAGSRYTDPAQTMPTSDDLAIAMRLGLEYGCDLVKTVYNGDPEGYAQAVASCHLPVIMAGGPKSDDELAIFHQLKEVMTHGACGAAIGRRVWGSSKPEATLDALRAIVMDDAPVEEAIESTRRGRQ